MNNCQQMRRKRVKHSRLDLATGITTDVRSEWVTEPCGAPLFAAHSVAIGKCPSCEGGWTHPENYPVETGQ